MVSIPDPDVVFNSDKIIKPEDISEDNYELLKLSDFVVNKISTRDFLYMSTENYKIVHIPYKNGLNTNRPFVDRVISILNANGYFAAHGLDTCNSYCASGSYTGIVLYKSKILMDNALEHERKMEREHRERRRSTYKDGGYADDDFFINTVRKWYPELPILGDRRPDPKPQEIKSWLQKMDGKYPWIRKRTGGLFKPMGI